MSWQFILFGLLLLQVHQTLASPETEREFTNVWAVQLDTQDEGVADEVAYSLGFVSRGTIGSLPGYFHFVHETTANRKKRSAEHRTKPLLDHPRVKWAEQQTLLHRFKRGYRSERQKLLKSRAEENKRYFNDPQWSDQWYLYDAGEHDTRNLKVLDAVRLGYTGKNVVVSIIDDGLDHAHPDLRRNYDSQASYDVNDNDTDPAPNATNPDNAHGTKCGGEVAAQENNGICGVGVAFGAQLGGIRMLDGPITDAVEAWALGFNPQYVDIKSASWGPSDDGKTFGKPEKLAEEALRTGAENGRGGKGTLFVWATGNGGRDADDCNCDGYTSNIHTLSIGSVSPTGHSTYYDEMCPSTMGVVYTGDIGSDAHESYGKLVTTALHNECVDNFSGTSCAAPLAAGIFALVLEANPSLTWRDVQHLVVETAEKNDPGDESWNTNTAGNKYSRAFGFGVLNAHTLVTTAKDWTPVGTQHKREVPGGSYGVIPLDGEVVKKFHVRNSHHGDQAITKLEHVQVRMSLTHHRRGNLVITLESPGKTTSKLLSRRRDDKSTDGLTDWPFMSVEFWGESPEGEWTLRVADVPAQEVLFDESSFQSDEPKLPSGVSNSDLNHGRFKEDYMKIAARSKGHNPLASDESLCAQDVQVEGLAGCVTEYSLVIYGTEA